MERTVILGAGFSGQYAEIILWDALTGQRGQQVTVVDPYAEFIDVPSPAWVGIGQVKPEAARFEQGPVYGRMG